MHMIQYNFHIIFHSLYDHKMGYSDITACSIFGSSCDIKMECAAVILSDSGLYDSNV